MSTIIILVLAIIVLTALSAFTVNQIFGFSKGIEEVEGGGGLSGGGVGGGTGGGTGENGGGDGEGGEPSGPPSTSLGVITEEGITQYIPIGEEQTFTVEGDYIIHRLIVTSADDSQANVNLDDAPYILKAGSPVEIDLSADGVNDISIKHLDEDMGKAQLTLKALPGRAELSYPMLCNYRGHECKDEGPSLTVVDFLPPLFAEIDSPDKYFEEDKDGLNWVMIDYETAPTQEIDQTPVLSLSSGTYVLRLMFDNDEKDLIGLYLRSDVPHMRIEASNRMKSWRVSGNFGYNYYFSEIFFEKEGNTFKAKRYRTCTYPAGGYESPYCFGLLNNIDVWGYQGIPTGTHTLYLDMAVLGRTNTENFQIQVI